MLTCQQMTELVTAYLEGALPFSDRRLAERRGREQSIDAAEHVRELPLASFGRFARLAQALRRAPLSLVEQAAKGRAEPRFVAPPFFAENLRRFGGHDHGLCRREASERVHVAHLRTRAAELRGRILDETLRRLL